ncbi:MAG: SDR family NAD(P)-dependent oxidoreductase [Pseudomonas sp.]
MFHDRCPDCLATLVDVGDTAQIDAVFKVQYEQFVGLDVLVKNAGIAAISDEEWQRTLDITLPRSRDKIGVS